MGAPSKPPREGHIEEYWGDPPPYRSARCAYWVTRIEAGWRPNRRISQMGYYESAAWFGVYIWEYLHVLSPMLWPPEEKPQPTETPSD